MLKSIKEIYNYREMLINLVKRDLRTRYKGSTLGFLWTFINPLLQLIVYSVVFSFIMRVDVENYPMFLFVALLPWIYFANTTQVGASLIIANSNIIKKIYFPREILPISTAVAGLINLAFSLIVALVALLIFKIPLTISLLALPLVMIPHMLFTLGVTFIISAVNVYMRDLEHLWGILIMAWFYFTPIVYPAQMVPERFLNYYYLNPLTVFITAYRDILYNGAFPSLTIIITLFAISLLMVALGYMLFKKLERNFAEII